MTIVASLAALGDPATDAPTQWSEETRLVPQDYPTIQAKEVARIPLKSVAPASSAERLVVALAPVKDGASAITLTWGDQSWTTDITGGGAATR